LSFKKHYNMKNFLIEFFRPLDNLIFNYLVKIGAIKPILGAIVGGLIASRSAKKGRQASRAAEERSRGDLERAFQQIRDPNAILREAYGSGGMFGADIQNRILGAEERLLPGFLDLQKQQAQSQLLGEGGLMDLGQASRLRELGFIGLLAPAARGLLEDPRLAEIAEMDITEAQRLGMEAGAPLSGERAREAEQSALQMAVRQGRGRGEGAIAQAVLGRTAAQTQLEQQAALARVRALQSSQIARIDPTALLGGLSPRVDAMSGAFLSQAPGTLVTDPGQAINVGSARDVQRANVLIGQGALSSQAGAARSQIAGQGYQALGSTLGGMDFSGIFGNKTPVANVGGVASFGQGLLGQANQIQNQIGSIGNISPFGGQMQQSTPFGGYTFP
jgi:hypothetical protein